MLRKELSKSFDGKVIVTGKGSLFMTHFIKDEITKVTNATQASMCNIKTLS